jgi:RNA polymerase sigma-70 factor (ECF subfamily)
VTDETTDSQLIEAYLRGEREAFTVLYTRYERALFTFVLSLGGTREQAEDIMQQTWMRALEALPRYEDQGRFRPWLFRIAHRRWLDHVRSAWERRRAASPAEGAADGGVPLDRFLVDPAPLPDEAATAVEARARLYRAIDGLPDAMRQALLLQIDGGLKHREIAEAMGVPLGTVLWRVREARKRLARQLGAES